MNQLPANSCPASANNGTTSISGVVYAPNGTDPLPNVQVYIPNAAVPAFPAGVQCPVVGAAPLGSPLVGAITDVNGAFSIANVPVGIDLPLVIVTGKWRRQVTVPAISSAASCTNTVVDKGLTRLPKNQSEGDIPLFAVATGSADSVECVLRKVGIDDAEFVNPSTDPTAGRIQLFTGSGSPGARIDGNTPSQAQLMSSFDNLKSYDVLMLPCQGSQFAQTAAAEATFDAFANAGGRVYSSHFSYVWMDYPGYTNGPFAGVANWQFPSTTTISPDPGVATINQGFAGGLTLAQWLQQPAIGASTTQGQIALSTLKRDTSGVVAPTQSWMTLNNAAAGNPVMQFVFDTPIGSANQCGRVLFNEYHVENPATGSSSASKVFPNECVSGQAATAQEKLLEYMLFELTDEGGAATLTPTTQDFGSQALNLSSASLPFVLTNNSAFTLNNPVITTSGPFTVASSTCSSILAGASCTINVIFTPTVIGANTGTLSANAGATSLLSALTGTGTPDLTFSIANLVFGSQDVGFSSSQIFSVVNTANGTVPVTLPTITPAGSEYSLTSNCPSTLAVGASCLANVTFKPTTTGPATASITDATNGATPSTLTGNGIDFTITTVDKSGSASSTGSIIAGNPIAFYTLTTPLAGFAKPLNLTCTTTAPGSICAVVNANFTPTAAVTSGAVITTTSEYSVVGYTGGIGRPGLLWLIALASSALLFLSRRRAPMERWGLLLILLGATTFGLSGCSGKMPGKNSVYTAPGTYTYTVSATDGFLVHTTTFSLTVTAD